ncbi:arylsulfatase [Pedobacter sp. GR22-6]|uniref:arylsulfatase n=1 Tax=Pedobacter sp. GR22-6 TaxID=3127957 RepID=UPI00307D7A09
MNSRKSIQYALSVFRLVILLLMLICCTQTSFSSALPKAAKQKQPNIIVILADDMGYSDLGCFGSEISTPNLDDMARNGLKMTQFYNASRCCPSRAALLTGLYPHQAGIGDMVNSRVEPAYQGYLNKNCVTLAEALRPFGYATFMAGKWHVGQDKAHWPLQRGFDRYFGLIDGASSYFDTFPYRANQKLTMALDQEEFKPDQPYYATDAYTDYALKFLEENRASGKPFFLYLAYQAPHWPLHALPEDIAKYKGKYMKGWDQIREARYRKMQAEGIIAKTTKLSPRDAEVPDWSSLGDEEKNRWDDQMAVYAAMIDRMDQNIGRLRKQLEKMGETEHTLILFLSDNGASHEVINDKGFLPEIYQRSQLLSSNPNSFTAYGHPGANVSNTPFRMFKHWEYEGGTASPFIAFGPGLVKAGRTVHTPAHVIDIMATCLQLAGGSYPSVVAGQPIKASAGISLVPVFRGQYWKGHDALYFEHEGNRAVRQGKWKLVSNFPENKWHLYNMDQDRTELQDLSTVQPAEVTRLSALYDIWAKQAEVIPFEKLQKKKGGTE